MLLGSPLGTFGGWSEPAPGKCVLLSTSRDDRKRYEGVGSVWGREISGLSSLMSWIWEGIWILPFLVGSSTWAARVRLFISRLVLIFALPLEFSWSGSCG